MQQNSSNQETSEWNIIIGLAFPVIMALLYFFLNNTSLFISTLDTFAGLIFLELTFYIITLLILIILPKNFVGNHTNSQLQEYAFFSLFILIVILGSPLPPTPPCSLDYWGPIIYQSGNSPLTVSSCRTWQVLRLNFH